MSAPESNINEQIKLFTEYMQFKAATSGSESKVTKPKKTKTTQVVVGSQQQGSSVVKTRVIIKDLDEQIRLLKQAKKEAKSAKVKKQYSDEEKAQLKEKMAKLRSKRKNAKAAAANSEVKQ